MARARAMPRRNQPRGRMRASAAVRREARTPGESAAFRDEPHAKREVCRLTCGGVCRLVDAADVVVSQRSTNSVDERPAPLALVVDSTAGATGVTLV